MSTTGPSARATPRHNGFIIVIAALGGAMALPAYAIPIYTLTDLGVLLDTGPGPATERRVAINDCGQIVGDFANGDLWNNGTWVDLDIPGPLLDINNAGQMVGNYRVWVQPGVFHDEGFLYDNGAWLDLNTGPVVAINNPGQVLARTGLWDDGVFSSFGITGGCPLGLDDLGRAVGYIYDPFGADRVFQWSNGTVTDLGTLGYSWARAYDINNAGQIVGTLGADHQTAFLWQQGETTLLGGALADAANDGGQVVGWAFLWDDGVYYDLNELLPAGSGWDLLRAYDINNNGWIVGKGSLGGQAHGFLLTPVPEPGTLALLALLASIVARGANRNASR